jgi:hypothetical protein
VSARAERTPGVFKRSATELEDFFMYENLWAYTPTSGHTPDADLTGYRVEATDGHIGKVDKHSDEVGSQYIVVDTGIWIFGKEVLLPAGTITTITHEDKTVHVARTKDEIKSAPEFDKEKHLGDPHYRDQLGGHYGSGH